MKNPWADWIHIENNIKNQQLISALLISGSKIGLNQTKFTSWLLGFTGATFLLTLAELNFFSEQITSYKLSIFWTLLFISGALGFTSKIIGEYASLLIGIYEEMGSKVSAVSGSVNESNDFLDKQNHQLPYENIKLDFQEAIKTMYDNTFFIYKRAFYKNVERGEDNPLKIPMKSYWLCTVQSFILFLQLALFISSWLYLVFNLG